MHRDCVCWLFHAGDRFVREHWQEKEEEEKEEEGGKVERIRFEKKLQPYPLVLTSPPAVSSSPSVSPLSFEKRGLTSLLHHDVQFAKKTRKNEALHHYYIWISSFAKKRRPYVTIT